MGGAASVDAGATGERALGAAAIDVGAAHDRSPDRDAVTAPRLARLTSVVLVVVVGMTLGHVLSPLPGSGVRGVRLAGFAVALAAFGGWRGAREAAIAADWHDRPVSRRARMRGAAIGAGAAVASAVLAHVAVHGR